MEMTHQVSSEATSKNVNNGAMKLALMLSAGALLLEPSIAAAAPWDAAVKNVADTLTGNLGKTIAIIAVVVLGLMAMAGKLEWMNAIKVVFGIVIVFSAAQIVNWIAPGAAVGDIPAANQADCNARAGVWVPASLVVADGGGTIIPARPAICVSPDIAIATCNSTVNGIAAPPAVLPPGYRAQPTYFAATTSTSLICQ